MKKLRYLLYPVLFLAACAGGDDAYQLYLQKRHVPLPSGHTLSHCHGYGCRIVSEITLSDKEWKQIEKIFKPKPKNAAAERRKIIKAIGLFEKLVGAKDGTNHDVMGTFRKTGDDQLDCVDESTNTTVYLALLQAHRLMRFHTLEGPTMRLPLINAGRWPHQTAVIRDTKTGIEWAIDSWFHDNGADAETIELKTWKSGWKPESVHDFL